MESLPHLQQGRPGSLPAGAALLLPLLFLSALAGPTAAPADEPAPEVGEIQVVGASVYDREAVFRIVRLRPGKRLHREASAVAEALETRYRDTGYPAATVKGSFDPDSRVLELRVDEGRLAGIAVEGLEGAAEARAIHVAGLAPGSVLRERDVWAALDRLADASDGALVPGDPTYRVDPSPEGPRLTLRVSKRSTVVGSSLGPPGSAPLFTRVDGLAPGVGVRLRFHDFRSYNHTDVYARGAYGFSSEHARFALGTSRPFGAQSRLVLGYEFHDLTDSDDVFRDSALEETLAGALFRLSYRDYFQRRGHEAYAFWRVSSRAHVGLNARSDDHASLPVTSRAAVFPRKDTPRPNAPVDGGSMRSLIATLRLTSDDTLFTDGGAERESFLLLRSLYGAPLLGVGIRLDTTFEVADADALGGDFTFRRFVGDLRYRQPLGRRWAVTGQGLLGLSGGRLPQQKRFALGGVGTLRGFRIKELPGENMGRASLELLREARFPRPGVAVFSDLGAVWSRGIEGSGIESDAGLGLFWTGPGGFYVRIDAAVPLTTSDGRRLRVTVRLQAPF